MNSGEQLPHDNEELDRLFRDPDAVEWMGTHLTELKRSVTEQRFRTQTLWLSVAAGLVVHVGSYLLRMSSPAEPLALVADLLYSLGFALWTGAVVVALVEIFPQRKERQVLEAIARYEAAIKGGNPIRKG